MDIDGNGTHVEIPKLGFWMANMMDVISSPQYEPFLRVFNSSGRTESEMFNLLMAKKWSPKNNDGMVMRTASFGHGRQRLDVCLRQGHVNSQSVFPDWPGEEPVLEVMEKQTSLDLLVPFAILATYRAKQAEAGLPEFERYPQNPIGHTRD